MPTDTHGDRNTGALRPYPEPSQPPETLDEPLDRLRAAADPDQIAAAVRDALSRLPLVLAAPDWLDDCGFDTEQTWWHGISGRTGAPATFQAARDHLADALDRARDTADEIRSDPDPARRSDAWVTHGAQTLRYVAGVSVYARGLLTHTTPQALQGVLESTARVAGTDRAEDLPTAVYDLLYYCNGVLVGDDDWEPSLADAARRWYGLTVASSVDHAWWQARDHIARAADEFGHAVAPWLHVPIDASSAAQLAGPLARGCDEAWGLVNTNH
ncbi:MAG TPA: hypothetical protein VGD84_10275 [Pseudonocardiaceae bacterium]